MDSIHGMDLIYICQLYNFSPYHLFRYYFLIYYQHPFAIQKQL